MTLLIDPPKEGRCFIISAPAGTGKTTLVNMLVKEFSFILANISFTTRQPRQGEVDAKDYHFISKKNFEEKIVAEEFLEYVKLYDDYYGSSKTWVMDQKNQGKFVILVIDTQGAIQLKGKLDAVYIFISPPSLDELRKRLSGRKTESPEKIEKRIEWASQEMQAIPYYDYLIINDDLLIAYEILKSIMIAEAHRIIKNSRNS